MTLFKQAAKIFLKTLSGSNQFHYLNADVCIHILVRRIWQYLADIQDLKIWGCKKKKLWKSPLKLSKWSPIVLHPLTIFF